MCKLGEGQWQPFAGGSNAFGCEGLGAQKVREKHDCYCSLNPRLSHLINCNELRSGKRLGLYEQFVFLGDRVLMLVPLQAAVSVHWRVMYNSKVICQTHEGKQPICTWLRKTLQSVTTSQVSLTCTPTHLHTYTHAHIHTYTQVQEQSVFLASHVTPIAIATPARLKQLLDTGTAHGSHLPFPRSLRTRPNSCFQQLVIVSQ